MTEISTCKRQRNCKEIETLSIIHQESKSLPPGCGAVLYGHPTLSRGQGRGSQNFGATVAGRANDLDLDSVAVRPQRDVVIDLFVGSST